MFIIGRKQQSHSSKLEGLEYLERLQLQIPSTVAVFEEHYDNVRGASDHWTEVAQRVKRLLPGVDSYIVRSNVENEDDPSLYGAGLFHSSRADGESLAAEIERNFRHQSNLQRILHRGFGFRRSSYCSCLIQPAIRGGWYGVAEVSLTTTGQLDILIEYSPNHGAITSGHRESNKLRLLGNALQNEHIESENGISSLLLADLSHSCSRIVHSRSTHFVLEWASTSESLYLLQYKDLSPRESLFAGSLKHGALAKDASSPQVAL